MPDESSARPRPIRRLLLGAILFGIILMPFLIAGPQLEAGIEQLIEAGAGNRMGLAALLAGALASDILLPVPSSVVSTLCGLWLGIPLGALTSLVGMTASCAIGYWVGRHGGRPLAERLVGAADLKRLEVWNERYRNGMLIVARPVPVLAEASVIFLGMLRSDPRQFAIFATLANTGISLAYATVGACARDTHAFIPAFAASLLLPGLALSLMRRRRRSAP